MEKTILFVVAAALCFVPVAARSGDYMSGDYSYNVSGQSATIMSYYGNDEHLVIPDMLGDYRVEAIGESAFMRNQSIKSVTFPDGLLDIYTQAFESCTSLENVTLPDKLRSIADNAFNNTPWLNNYAEDFIVAGKNLYKYAGKGTEAVVPEGITWINNGAFANNSALTKVTLPLGVRTIGERAFYRSVALTEVNIPDGVISIGAAAFCNTGITAVTLPDSVKFIGNRAFWDCRSITRVTLSKNMGFYGKSVFESCTSLTELTILEGIETIGDYMFFGCTSLEKVDIPDSVTSIRAYAFGACYKLAEVLVPIGADVDSTAFDQTKYTGSRPDGFVVSDRTLLKYIGDYQHVVIPKGIKRCAADAVFDKSKLTNVTIPSSMEIVDRAFYGFEKLKTIVIAYGTTKIGEYAFGGCSALETVEVPPSVTEIGIGAFSAYGAGGHDNDGTSLSPPDNLNVTLKGYAGSYAEMYSNILRLKFESIAQLVALRATVTLMVNDEWINTAIWEINDNNFFKLRDIADMLNGRGKQFEVVSNDDGSEVRIYTNKAYTSVGNKPYVWQPEWLNVAFSNATVFVDDKQVHAIAAYTIDGYNYFKLRDVLQAINCGLTWENDRPNIIKIYTDQEYAAPM